MYKLNQEVKAQLEKKNGWILATSSDEGPNCIPVFFTQVLPDGRLAIGDAFMDKTLKNLEKNNRVAITVFEVPAQGYQVKGTAQYIADGAVVEAMNVEASALGLVCKGALLVDIDKVYITTPGPDVGKTI